MEVSSGISVFLLDIQSNDHFLDLCCAPGNKLTLASLCMKRSSGSVTGVDVNLNRLNNAISMVKKHKLKNVRLFHMDSVLFDVPVHCIKSLEDKITGNVFHELYSSVSPVYSSSIYRKGTKGYLLPNIDCYDKVLVDVECSHEGSLKHVLKLSKNKWNSYETDYFEESKLDSLTNVQLNLLNRGYSMLRPSISDSILIYSTCSLSPLQNEEIIYKFLSENSTARLLNRNEIIQRCINCNLKIEEAIDSNGFIKFSPLSTKTSGLFIALIKKLYP